MSSTVPQGRWVRTGPRSYVRRLIARQNASCWIGVSLRSTIRISRGLSRRSTSYRLTIRGFATCCGHRHRGRSDRPLTPGDVVAGAPGFNGRSLLPRCRCPQQVAKPRIVSRYDVERRDKPREILIVERKETPIQQDAFCLAISRLTYERGPVLTQRPCGTVDDIALARLNTNVDHLGVSSRRS